MKKLAILQALACMLTYVPGRYLGLQPWHIMLFLWVPIILFGFVGLWWFRNVFFFRDPKREIPGQDNVLVSPADGRVMYLYQVKAGQVVSNKQGQHIAISELAKTQISQTEGWLMGIYMTPFDVHFCRAPMRGQIKTIHYHQTGMNLPMVDLWEYINFAMFRRAINMFAAKFHLENERMTIELRNKDLTCYVILIADKFVNKITKFFSDSQEMNKGDKIAFIQRGSQTDLFFCSSNLTFEVKVGQQVYAGRTVIARIG